ncbi:OsmC family protein [Lysobacter sp. CA199]|uniref:OsmC family protein n=1 Tax=Lysobacter sp. CA199 TaxID=3455608 RepID=UPI003F8D8B17
MTIAFDIDGALTPLGPRRFPCSALRSQCTFDPETNAVEISALVSNTPAGHTTTVRTDAASQSVPIPAKATGRGSAVNGGEFLMLALATCYCNDVYREAARLGIPIDSVEVEATADFPGVGLAATNIRYRARVSSSAADASVIADLLRQTDAVAEVHNTIRAGADVALVS